jgi:uncharacterized integral membrane protein (TIGR00697 family)
MALFAVIIVVSNIASSAKIVNTGLTLFGRPLVFDGGTILFPISYIFGDVLTEVYGFRASRRVIWTGFALAALAAVVFAVLGALPGDAIWQKETGQAAYNAVLGGMCSGGIVIASLAGYLFGEFSNSVVLSKIKILMRGRLLFVRTIGSTLVGEALDTMIFVGIATLFRVFPAESFVGLCITNYLLKCGIEAIMTPVTYLVVGKLKKAEGLDVYDIGVKYHPISFSS